MTLKSKKITKTLFAAMLLLCAIGIAPVARVYSDSVTPLVNVNMQGTIDGAILLPHTEFSLSDSHNPITSGEFVFIFICQEHTAGTPPAPIAKSASSTATLRTPRSMSKDGHVFAGWRNGNHVFQPWQTFNLPDSTTHFYFYAVWAPAVILTLEANGGMPEAAQVRRGAGTQMRNLPQPPAKPGHIFLGWFNTSEPTGGVRLNTHTTVPDTNTTYWARWITPVNTNFYFENLVNLDSNEATSQADTAVWVASNLLRANFGINLQQPGPTRYEPLLNTVGASATHILDINPSSYTTVVFRFVDFPLHDGQIAGLARQARGMEGTTGMNLGDMVVTTALTQEMLTRAVVHEISHVFGAHDCNNFGCVMDISWLHTIHDNWCAACQSDINHYLYVRRRNNPHL